MARGWIARSPGRPDDWEFADVDVPPPGPGEVTIRVRAAGVNPADAKHVAVENGQHWPVAIGYEVSGEITALGPDTEIGSGPAKAGDEVIAFRVAGGYATEITVDASKAFHKPATLTHPEAANLLLTGTTAAEMLDVVAASTGETILLHGASGAVGVAVLQWASHRGIRVIGTAAEGSFDRVRRFGGIPVAYGPGLSARVVTFLDGVPLAAALDAVGTDEAVDVSLELVPDRAHRDDRGCSARRERGDPLDRRRAPGQRALPGRRAGRPRRGRGGGHARRPRRADLPARCRTGGAAHPRGRAPRRCAGPDPLRRPVSRPRAATSG